MKPFPKKASNPFLFKISSNLMLHLLGGFLLEGYDNALYYIIDELLVLVCGVSEVTESDGWHDTPALSGTPAERDRTS